MNTFGLVVNSSVCEAFYLSYLLVLLKIVIVLVVFFVLLLGVCGIAAYMAKSRDNTLSQEEVQPGAPACRD